MSYALKILALFLFLSLTLSAKDFRVATYNVENLFDMHFSGSEYNEYIPNAKSGWNSRMYIKKVENLAKVILDLDADILALQEVESKEALEYLNSVLKEKKYRYIYIQQSNSPVKNALLSRYKILSSKELHVKNNSRAISEVILDIDTHELAVYLNHWPSYKHGNASRIAYAKVLQKLYESKKEYILLGDFNSPFEIEKEEWGEAVKKLSSDRKNYNLWFEVPAKKRYSYVFFKEKKALDHIIISKSMFDKKGIDYKAKSFNIFIKPYLLDKYENPKRWQISKKGKGKHQGEGFSDHLAIYGDFTF